MPNIHKRFPKSLILVQLQNITYMDEQLRNIMFTVSHFIQIVNKINYRYPESGTNREKDAKIMELHKDKYGIMIY